MKKTIFNNETELDKWEKKQLEETIKDIKETPSQLEIIRAFHYDGTLKTLISIFVYDKKRKVVYAGNIEESSRSREDVLEDNKK